MPRLTAVFVLGLVLAGCGGPDDDALCDTAGSARLCLVETPGSYTIEAEDLEPGTEVTLSIDGETGKGMPVGDDGTLSGVRGLLGVNRSEITIEGVAADGQTLELTVNG